jgi:radical SAM superfamily enzyme YgiQ (UPF0313 family)
LRNVINKNVTTEDLLETVAFVAKSGFSRIKLYFMCALPTETEADLEAIAQLGHQVHHAARKAAPGKPPRVTVSVSNFVPKPHTPFQTLDMVSEDVLREKHRFIESRCNSRLISLRFHDPAESVLEAVFSRGDTRLGRVIFEAYRRARASTDGRIISIQFSGKTRLRRAVSISNPFCAAAPGAMQPRGITRTWEFHAPFWKRSITAPFRNAPRRLSRA